MKKNDLKNALNERLQYTEWTQEDTWSVLRKIRGSKKTFNRRLITMVSWAAALVLIVGLGVGVFVTRPGAPDQITVSYTPTPVEMTALTGGEGAGAGDLPAAAASELENVYPGVAKQLLPVGQTVEKQGIRVEVISGLVRGSESWFVYSIQAQEGADPSDNFLPYGSGSIRNIAPTETTKDEYLWADDAALKSYRVNYQKYSYPVQPEDRTINFTIDDIRHLQNINADLLPFLKEYAKEETGVAPSGYSKRFSESEPEDLKVLDTASPLDIPLGRDDFLLKGIGWIDNQLHVQIKVPNTQCTAYVSAWVDDDSGRTRFDLDDPRGPLEHHGSDGTWDGVSEYILTCTPQDVNHLTLSAFTDFPVATYQENWQVNIPLKAVCVESDEQADPAAIAESADSDVTSAVESFFRAWAQGDAESLRFYSAGKWTSSVNDSTARLRSLIASGAPVSYQINSISGHYADPERTVTCTVRMRYQDGSDTYQRFTFPVQWEGRYDWYQVDPNGFRTWEPGEYIATAETVDLSSNSDINNALHTAYEWVAERLISAEPVGCRDQGIRVTIHSGMIRGDQAYYLISLQDDDGRYGEWPMDPVFNDILGNTAACQANLLYYNGISHTSVYMVTFDDSHPVASREGYASQIMDSVSVKPAFQADLTALLKQYGTAAEGVEPPYLAKAILESRHSGPTQVPDLKVLDYTRSLEIPLFENTTLSGIGWIDGKLHVQIHHAGIAPSESVNYWINSSLNGKTDTLWTELDYSPVEWYDDDSFWYDFVFDYNPEDLDQLKMSLHSIAYETQTLTGIWAMPFDPEVFRLKEDTPAGAAENTPVPDLSVEGLNREKDPIPDAVTPANTPVPDIPDNQGSNLQSTRPAVSMELDKTRLAEGETVNVTVSVTNNSDAPLIGPVTLFDPNNKTIEDFNYPILEAGESQQWTGSWTVTSQQLKEGKITYSLKYAVYADETDPETGRSELQKHRVNFSKKITAAPENSPVPDLPAEGLAGAENPLPDAVTPTNTPVPYPWYGETPSTEEAEEDLQYSVWRFFSSWVNHDENGISILFTLEQRYADGDPAHDLLQYLTGIGLTPLDYQINSVSGTSGDAERTVVCTSQMKELKGREAQYIQTTLNFVKNEAGWYYLKIGSPLEMRSVAASDPSLETVSLSPEDIIADGLKYEYDLTEALKPLNLTAEKQDIRMDVRSALAKGKDLWVLYSVQDLTGKHDPRELNTYLNAVENTFGSEGGGETTVLLIDDDQHRITYCLHVTFKQPIPANDRTVALRTDDLCILRTTDVDYADLAPLLEQYAVTTEGVTPPELITNYSVAAGYEVPPQLIRPDSLKILDYQNPLNVDLLPGNPSCEGIKLTGIGWIDGKLHVQLHSENSHKVNIGGGERSSWYASGSDVLPDSVCPRWNPVQWDENGDMWGDWAELVFDGTPETLKKYSSLITLYTVEEVLEDTWAFDFPISQILAD